MNTQFFDEETGETIASDFPNEYYQNVRQLAHDLKQSQGGFDEESLIVIMEMNPADLPNGWDEFVRDMNNCA